MEVRSRVWAGAGASPRRVFARLVVRSLSEMAVSICVLLFETRRGGQGRGRGRVMLVGGARRAGV